MGDPGSAHRWRRRASRWVPAALVAAVAAAGAALNTTFDEPPRFDGAGYAMLGRALLEGEGYRDIDHPDAPSHAHFPPAYPALLAATWAVTGRSAAVAHTLSILCTTGAVVAAWWWFRWQYRRRVALLMGLALAMNWSWQRVGGGIQSEPLYMLLKQLALLAAVSAARSGGGGRGARLGGLLGTMTLTRLIGVVVGLAVGIELMLRRRWRALAAMVATSALVVSPWAWWLATSNRKTHLGYFPGESFLQVVAGNAWFYVLRLPDALTGPFVEVGTVFSPGAYPLAAGFAVGFGLVMTLGLAIVLRIDRLRTAGLVVACNLALLLIWPFTEAGRFIVPLVPALLVVAVEGFSVIARRLGRARPRVWASALLLALAMPYSTYTITSGRAEARQETHQEVDAGLDWIARHGDRQGPIMTAYPAEAFWFTDRPGIVPPDDPEEIRREIDRYGIAYLVVVEDRFARAREDPLFRFIERRPDRVRRAWSSESASVSVYEVMPGNEPDDQ